MKISNVNTPQSAPITDVKSKSVAKSKSTESSNSSQDRKSASSSHRQLIGLAKHFGIGAAVSNSGEKDSLQERARKRELILKARKQQNLENVITIAMGFATEEHPSLAIDPDWFNQFQLLAQDISHREMQKLWAKILVGEIAQPGSFSLKTLYLFKTLSVNEASIFANACQLAVKDKRKASMRILTGYYVKPSLFSSFIRHKSGRLNLSEFDLSYADILTLSNLGLLFSDEIESQALNKNKELDFQYNGLSLKMLANRNDCVVNFYKFTQVGTELARLISDAPNTAYHESLKATFGHHFSIN